MPIKPFKWTNLKKVSGAEQESLASLFELLPATSARQKLSIEIRRMLMKHLGEKSFYYLDSIEYKQYAGFTAEFPDNAIISVIGMEPAPHKAVVYIDSGLAFLVIDRLLGGSGEPMAEGRRLTETERGVIQYLIMQVLSQVWRVCGKASRLHFRFEKFCSSPQDAAQVAGGRETAVSVCFKVGIGEYAGFVKLIFPAAFIEKLASVAAPVKTAVEADYFKRRLARYGYVRTALWAEGGRLAISPEDLAGLEAGDVMIFDESGISLSEGQVKGEVDLRVGRGEAGGLRASVASEKNLIRCKIE